MKLEILVESLKVEQRIGDFNIEIDNLQLDSRKVTPGSLFVAIRGSKLDGHKFIDKAIENGADAVVFEELPPSIKEDIAYLQVADSAAFLGDLANRFYGFPSTTLQLVGITGTNGKTTTATLLYHLFTALGYKCGLLSTIVNKIGERDLPAALTTPDAIAINRHLSEMVLAGCSYVFMEVSSHAVHQKRIAGLTFRGGVFTNITHDHLDYHGTFDAYIKAKKAFFDGLDKEAFALINADDKNGTVMVQNTKAAIYRYSLKNVADFKGKIIENSLLGMQLEINARALFCRLIGAFNAYNLLAAYGVARLLDQKEEEVLIAMSTLQAIEGRFDYVSHHRLEILGIVDYAHTPDALSNVLSTILELKPRQARVITVVGCGGDRDKTKRPEMARVACLASETVILTSDNPRTEPPDAIIKDMETGVPANGQVDVLSISDRKTAIKTACRLAGRGDIILVAGKGHEKYQEINGEKLPFDDKKVLTEALKALPSRT